MLCSNLVTQGTAGSSKYCPRLGLPEGFRSSDLRNFLGDDRYTAASLMAFVFSEKVEDLAYTVGQEIYSVVLPKAVGGEGKVTYRVSELPEGLLFDASTRTILLLQRID